MMDNCGQILNVLNEYMTLRMVVICNDAFAKGASCDSIDFSCVL